MKIINHNTEKKEKNKTKKKYNYKCEQQIHCMIKRKNKS